MKKLLSLLLCLLLLFSVGCKKEAPALGEFYEEDGIWQNTLITAELRDADLTAPVTELSYVLIDNCDFKVTHRFYTNTNDYRNDRLETYVMGEWREAPTVGNRHLDRAMFSSHQDRPSLRTEYALHLECNGTPEGYAQGRVRYKPLEAGEYRLRILYSVETNYSTEDIEIPKDCEAVIYFTVK